MKCKFVVGQRVVCIKTEPWVFHYRSMLFPSPSAHPFNGEIYTIAEMIEAPDLDIYLRFEELEPYAVYHHSYFRPMDDTKIKKSTKIRELA